nr:ZFP3 [Adonis amurensis]
MIQINGVSSSSNSSTDKLDEAMWHLKIESQNEEEEAVGNSGNYPDRPGEPDCIYYLRTGMCGYGSNCRFNHPNYIGQVVQYSVELPERPGQPECQYFLKTGACKFGSTCKYHHPRDKNIATQVPLNVYGLPMRQDEKPCPYYMRTWSCKFGVACKFHHPQPAGVGTVLPVNAPPTYGSTGSSIVPSSGLSYVSGPPAWSIPRAPSIPGLPLQNSQAYMPFIFSPSQGITPTQPRWNTYMGEGGLTGQDGYPERPEQPECQYFLKTGRCKFGSDCKYHHPKSTCDLSPLGLPLRPGQAVCTNYSMYGSCKFGSSCKFDHPWTGYYSYGLTMPTLPVIDPSLFPKPLKISPPKSSKLPNGSKIEEIHTENLVRPTKEATSPTHTIPNSSEQPHEHSD